MTEFRVKVASTTRANIYLTWAHQIFVTPRGKESCQCFQLPVCVCVLQFTSRTEFVFQMSWAARAAPIVSPPVSLT
jgi:hypothetical protein